MILLLILVLIVTQMYAINDDIEGLSHLEKLIGYISDTELKTNIGTKLENVVHEIRTLRNRMINRSYEHILDGLELVDEILYIDQPELPELRHTLEEIHECYSKDIRNCIDEVDYTIDEENAIFAEISEVNNIMATAIVLRYLYQCYTTECKVESGYSFYSVRGGVIDDLIKKKFESIDQHLNHFFAVLGFDSIVIPNEVKSCVQNTSKKAKMHLRTDRKIKEVSAYITPTFEETWDETQKLSTNIRSEIVSHIVDGFRVLNMVEVEEELSNALAIKIGDCAKKDIEILNSLTTRMEEVLEKAYEKGKLIVSSTVNEIRNLKMTEYYDDLDEISDNLNSSLSNFKEKYESIFALSLDHFLNEVKQYSILMPLNVKKCVDEILNSPSFKQHQVDMD